MYLMEPGLHLQQLYRLIQGFPVVQLEKNLPAMWETWALSLGWEDPLEEATPASLPGEFHAQQSLAGYCP